MSTKFIFDRVQKEREETIEEIFRHVRKKPYPDPKTTMLANFVEAMFQVHQKKHRHVKHEEDSFSKLGHINHHPVMAPKIRPLPMAPRPHTQVPQPTDVVVPVMIPSKKVTSIIPEAPQVPVDNKPLTPKAGEPLEETDLLPPAPVAAPVQFQPEKYIVSTFDTNVTVDVKEDEAGNPLYTLQEPLVKQEVLQLVKEYIKKDFEKDFQVLDNADYINKKIEKACKKEDIECTPEMIKDIIYYLKRDLLGFRKIDPIMYDEKVDSIYIDGLNKPVIVDFKGTGKIKTNLIFTDTKDLNVLLARLAKATGNTLSEENPILDADFEGYRVQAILGMGGASSKLVIKKEIVEK